MRLTLFLALSVAIHLFFIESLPPLSLSSAWPLKSPIWVDLVNLGTQSERLQSDTVSQAPVPPEDQAANSPASKETGDQHAPESLQPQPGKDKQGYKEQSPTPIPVAHGTKSPAGTRPTDVEFDPPAEARPESPDEIEYERYLLDIKKRVETHWQVALDDEIRAGTTVISAVASSDGSLWSIDIVEPSGMILHDYEALEAVKQAFPLRPPPFTLLNEQSKLPIRFSFHYLLPSSP